MNIISKQVSNMVKIKNKENLFCPELSSLTAFKGESLYYQIGVYSEKQHVFEVKIESDISEFITLYEVKDAIVDFPAPLGTEDLIINEPGTVPDILIPIKDIGNCISINSGVAALWVSINLPENIIADNYDIKISFKSVCEIHRQEYVQFDKKLTLNVADITMKKQTAKVTNWMHIDSIADIHNVEIYSDIHWELIDKYMKQASEFGINMVLTPIITPPLDTKIGKSRPDTQLVKIEREDGKYIFDFSLLSKWIEMAKKNNMKYFEMAHLFSQWGLEYAPNIYITEKGELKHLFGWHTKANSVEYKEFLEAFLPELVEFLDKAGIKEEAYFHISDEPDERHMENYRYAYNLVKSLIGDVKILDALSAVEFYDMGLTEIPVPSVDRVENFLNRELKERWVYYCCYPCDKYTNRFMAMHSYQTRILGLQMYNIGIENFLHWGYNFYYNQYSVHLINPYVTTSGDRAFSSGDSFIVYPGKNKPIPSLRGYILKTAFQDITILKMLEETMGRDAVLSFIEEEASGKVTMTDYPRNDEFLPQLIEKAKKTIIEKRLQVTDNGITYSKSGKMS